MWSSSTSAIRLLIPPRTFASKHENVRAIVVCGERTFDGVDLSANAFDAGNQLLLFFVHVRHTLLVYPRGVWYKMRGGRLSVLAGETKTPYEHKFRTRTSKYPESSSCVAMSAQRTRL